MKKNNTSDFYCQRDIEGESKCKEQCDHCKEYYAPLENKQFKIAKLKEIDEDILDIKAWFGNWDELKKRINELEDDEKEEAFERNERNKVN